MKKFLFIILCMQSSFFVLTAQEIKTVLVDRSFEDIQNDNVAYTNKVAKLDPVFSVLFSSLLAGGGQYYNGQYLKGLIMTGTQVGGIALVVSGISLEEDAIKNPKMFFGGLIISGGAVIWSMIDAGMSTEKINKQNGFSLHYKISKHLDLAMNSECNYRTEADYNNTIYGFKAALFFH